MARFRSESDIINQKYLGDPLVPEPFDQGAGLDCVLIAIKYAGQMELRRVMFGKQWKCDLVFDAGYFKYIYERETRVTLAYDRKPRIRTGLRIFRDLGIQVMSPTLRFAEVPVVHLIDFEHYPPKYDHITGEVKDGLDFDQVMDILQKGKPVLGSFAVDENFGKLGADQIYDFIPEEDITLCDTHCVMFIDGGVDETGREYLKFLNSHGPGFGDKGFGRVYFDCILQINSEFCFHTLSFEGEAPQHAPPRSVEAPSAAEQLGVTPAGLMDPLTQSDYTRTNELQQFLISSQLSENSEDSGMREKALQKLDGIVKTCVRRIAEKGQMTEMPSTLVLACGSYSLQVLTPSSQVEVVCLGPHNVNREELFKTLHGVLRNMPEVADLETIQKEETTDNKAVDRQFSAARFLKFRLHGKLIILIYATLSKVPAQRSDIFQDLVLSCIDEANLPSLDKCRAPAAILELVPNIKHFQTTLQYVNFWARRRAVYSNMTGFLGGIHWAIMVARVCQIYPRAVPSVLVMKFFQEYAHWFWPAPVMLCLIQDKDPFSVWKQWNTPRNKVDTSHVMPIITPAYPCRNCSSCVSESTLMMIRKEFILGFEMCEKIKKGEADWSALCQPLGFFNLHKRYLQLLIKVKDAGDLWMWKLKVEPLWMELPLKIEAYGDHTMRAHLHPYEYYDRTKKTCSLFMGLSKVTAGPVIGQVVTTPLQVPREVLTMFKMEIDRLKGPGMEIEFLHHLQQRVAPVVSKLISDCLSEI